jgi:hypothetical protein
MAYNILHLENLAELKLRSGGSTVPTLATILGLNYPTEEAFSVYVWDQSSTVSGDDNEIVVPTSRINSNGRWFKVELSVAPHNHPKNQITGLQSDLDSINTTLGVKLNVSDFNTILAAYRTKTENDALYRPASWLPLWSQIPGRPTYYLTNTDNVNGLSNLLNQKINVTDFNTIIASYRTKSQNDLLYKPIDYIPSSADINAAIGYTPTPSTRTITINGTTQDLSANRSWDVGGVTEAQVNTTNFIKPNTFRAAVDVANSNNRVPIFNSVTNTWQNSVVASTGYSNYSIAQRSATGTLMAANAVENMEVVNLQQLQSAIASFITMSTPLTGLSFASSAQLQITDNLLVAVGKLQAQLNVNRVALSSVLVGQTKAQLNAAYPTTPVGFMVLAPSITLGGAIYVRCTAGASGEWQIISAPRVL